MRKFLAFTFAVISGGAVGALLGLGAALIF